MKSLLRALPLAMAAAVSPMLAHADISFVVGFAPPPLPVYVQPPIPAYGYIWTPGYWSWSEDDGDYFWVPGTWVVAPYVGALWTPGYWVASGDRYSWHEGFWGTRIGFYGGVNYGHGYCGVGYQGGYWDHGEFRYNRAANNIANANITNVYNTTIVNNINGNRVSYNGGVGGIHLHPTSAEQFAVQQPHMGPTAMQLQHHQTAFANPMQMASVNHGMPSVAATPVSGAFKAPNPIASAAPNPHPTNRFYGGTAQYQPTAQPQQAALQPQFQQQPVPHAVLPERLAPREGLQQHALTPWQPPATPLRHETMRPQTAENPQWMARPAPQEHGHQLPVPQAQVAERQWHPEPARAQVFVQAQAHQSAAHLGHSNDREFHEK